MKKKFVKGLEVLTNDELKKVLGGNANTPPPDNDPPTSGGGDEDIEPIFPWI